MNEYMHRDHLRDLWIQIDKLHLSYLQADESPYKIEERNKLESYIREYLCLAPHDRKFCFRETANVLHQSATLKESFSAYRAAAAWNALGLYAANLLSQPWRKEYRILKMYCGFYKHEIDANLVGAEVMLEAMGYKHVGNTTMVLEGPIDPDRVSNVSRDSLMAAVECQLLKMIWEEVSRRFQCRWLEVLEFRENHVCTPENAVKGLMYQFHQREYQEQHQHQMALYHHQTPVADSYGTARFHTAAPGCLYGQISPTLTAIPPHIGYYNYSPYAVGSPHAYTLPSQPRYGTVMSPQQAPLPYPLPAPTHPSFLPSPLHGVLKSQDLYPTTASNALHQYQTPVSIASQPAPPAVPAVQMGLQNGYSIHNSLLPHASGQNYGCLVPTGQLIELDAAPPSCSSETQQTFSATDSSGSVLIPKTVRQHQCHQLKKNSGEKHKQDTHSSKHAEASPTLNYPPDAPKIDYLTKKAKDEGTGTFESWDYVFRNLESQGYNKDLGERPDILLPVDAPANSSYVCERNIKQDTEALDLEDTLMEMRLEEMQRKLQGDNSEYCTMKINEALEKMKLEPNVDRGKQSVSNEAVDGSLSVYDNMSSPPKDIISKQRPFDLGGELNNSNTVSGKSAIKTLPRESKKHSGESKRLNTANPYYSSVTLDTRQLSEQNTSVAPEVPQYNENPTKKNPGNRSKNSSNIVERRPHERISKWECVTCTFHNDTACDICEMCGKSKVRGPESQPLASGGRECPQCTLVNERDVGTCVACECSLKDSPTYI